MPSVLLTGASSFTGLWFARELAARGHQVTAPLTSEVASYSGIRARRVAALAEVADVVPAAPLGSDALTALVTGQVFDVLGVHHAVVGDYRSPDFDTGAALAAGTAGARDLLAVLAAAGTRGLVLTHSVFESGRGLTDEDRPIGLYAVAKRAHGEMWAEWARQVGLPVSGLCITNPFGPGEEPRLVTHLVRTWTAGEVPELRAPDWIRDNVPVPLLARAYADAVEVAATGGTASRTPSHRPQSNLAFAQQIGERFGSRWDRPCPVGRTHVHDEGEPYLRVGTDKVDWSSPEEQLAFWDRYADFYARPEEML